jgi:hypothetical protein
MAGTIGIRLAAVLGVALCLGVAAPATDASSLFQPYVAYPVGSWPEAVAVGDATGDGLPDVVMTTGLLLRSGERPSRLGLRPNGRRDTLAAGLLPRGPHGGA